MRHLLLVAALMLGTTTARAGGPGHDFTPVAHALFRVGACGAGTLPAGFSPARISKHCAAVTKTQAQYVKKWVTPARAFFAEKVPANLPKKVVYPFAGGDLSTALTVFPDADEITTLSLEPAGDPRTLEALRVSPRGIGGGDPKITKGDPLRGTFAGPGEDSARKEPAVVQGKTGFDRALATIEYELNFLYVVNFSNTMNMIDAMRGGQLPTQLVFGLSALNIHGFEVVGLRYFKLDENGAIQYLTDADVAAAPDPMKGKAEARNRVFANAELQYRRPGGRIQTYRHIQVNLDDAHLAKDPRVLRHLQAKGPIAGMTKAASFLLGWDSFRTIRSYLLDHVQWMVSDATGVPPKFGKPAGFEYETYGAFTRAHIEGGNQIAPNWRAEFAAQPKRKLAFRFGYYDGSPAHTNHLVIMRKR
ncbi:MAG TPA: hypothetical protein VM513_12350 [Kofleriaceae bacterium]|jgi:hypothetical protein|nr:hypothetical protein [Kofleriaceae bacterium]